MSSDNALKPCPFCGNAEPVYALGYLRCAQCHSQGPYRSEYTWNDRAPDIPEDLVEDLRGWAMIMESDADWSHLESLFSKKQLGKRLRDLLAWYEGRK